MHQPLIHFYHHQQARCVMFVIIDKPEGVYSDVFIMLLGKEIDEYVKRWKLYRQNKAIM